MRLQFVVTILAYMGLVDTAKLCNETRQNGIPYQALQIVQPPESGIALLDHTYRLSCKSTKQGRTRTLWEHDGRRVDTTAVFPGSRSRRYEISDSGELMFNRIRYTDRGSYRCIVQNRKCYIYSKRINLAIHAPVTFIDWDEGVRHIQVEYEKRLHLECRVVGIPTPVAAWWYIEDNIKIPVGKTPLGGGQVASLSKKQSDSLITLIMNIENVTKSASYMCVASNTIVSKKHNLKTIHVHRTASVTVIKRLTGNRSSLCQPPRMCGACQKYTIAHRLTRVRYRGNNHRHARHDRPLANLSHTEDSTMSCRGRMAFVQSHARTDACRVILARVVCLINYPDCFSHHFPLCRESCKSVSDSCLAHLHKHDRDGVVDCDSVPGIATNLCSNVSLTVPASLVTKTCYKGRGQWYQGQINTTVSGLSCQRWVRTAPHNHTFSPYTYIELLGSSNQCRNPGSSQPSPWCYTVDPEVRWQPCDVPLCDNSTSDSRRRGATLTEHHHFVVLVVSVCSGIIFIFVCLLIVSCLMCHGYIHCRRLPWTYSHRYDLTLQSDENDIDLEKIPSNEMYRRVKDYMSLSSRLTGLEYPRNDIIFMRDLGHGAFGRVFLAKAPRIVKGTDSTTVAVKMLKDDASDELREEFEREASLVAELRHENIIRLLGICCSGKPLCLLFEYMCHGDLHDFLRLSGPEHYILRRNTGLVNRENLENESLNGGVKAYMCEQIAAAMVYLSQCGYIHRDLAARNCLVSDRFTVKISDFGLARRVDSSECYKGSETDAIPIRWMPIEAILYNRFTVESDIWSFGVVMWEVFSFAQQPYGDLSHEDVIEYVKSGRTLECPIGTPQSAYDLMTDCWYHKPCERPSFTKLHKSLYKLHLQLSKTAKCTNHYHYLEL